MQARLGTEKFPPVHHITERDTGDVLKGKIFKKKKRVLFHVFHLSAYPASSYKLKTSPTDKLKKAMAMVILVIPQGTFRL